MKFVEAMESILGKGLTRTIVIIGCTVWISVWFATLVRELERAALGELARIDAKNLQQDARIDLAWTVQMMAARDNIVAMWNPTNRIPDAWRIYHDIRAGRDPVAVRIGP